MQKRKKTRSSHKFPPFFYIGTVTIPGLLTNQNTGNVALFSVLIVAITQGAHTVKQQKYEAVYNSAMDIFGKRERRNPDWFKTGIVELEPVIVSKRAALIEHKRKPSVKSLVTLR